jgi:transcriptional regulator with XRE-family HTH domain
MPSATRSLTDLAATTGISVSTLSRLEAGQRRTSLELLPIAQAYGVPVDELIGRASLNRATMPMR